MVGVQHTEGVPGGEEVMGMQRTRLPAVSCKQWMKKTSVFPKWEHLPLMSLRGVFFFLFLLFLFFQGSREWKKVLF